MENLRPRVLFIDNYDSFSFNLVDDLLRRNVEVEVWRNDLGCTRAMDTLSAMGKNRLLVISPGPGSPSEAGCCIELLQKLQGTVPVFGVCLGHQAIVEAYGGTVGFAGEIVHGRAAAVKHDGCGIFAGLDQPFIAARYHSLAASELPADLRVTARCGDVVMAVEHCRHPVIGVQFHPESILTPQGGELMDRILEWAVEKVEGNCHA